MVFAFSGHASHPKISQVTGRQARLKGQHVGTQRLLREALQEPEAAEPTGAWGDLVKNNVD